MSRILGLDIGSYSVKGVLLDATMRAATLQSYAAARRPDLPDSIESWKRAVGELLQNKPPPADQVLVSLPGPTLATHVLTLPFTDAKRLEATIPFEIESQLPFDLAEAVFDYHVGAQREKQSDLLVGVVRKQELAALLGALAALQIDPRIVTHPGLAYAYLLNAFPASFGEAADAVAVVDLGHERTTVAIGHPGAGVEFTRTFAAGGKDLTRALAAELRIPAAEAAAWKETNGALGAHISGPDGERAAGALIRGLQPVMRELRQSFKAHAGRTRHTVSRMYLCGGTSLLPGLDEQLANDFSIPARRLELPPAVVGLPAEQQPQAMQAFALATGGQASGAKALRFNLRRGEYTFKGHFDYVRECLGRLAAFAAVLVGLLVAAGLVRNALLSRREQTIDDVLCVVTQRVLGKCQKSYDLALNLLHGKESPTAAIPKLSAATVLAEFTNRMPSDVPVTFEQVDVTLDRLSVRIQTDSPKSIDRITTALKTYKCFKEVREGKIEKNKDGQNIARLDIEVECPEENRPPQG